MLIKAGVDISRLNREIRRALPELEGVLGKDGEELVITSTYEGTHGAGSLHYSNDAVDVRLPQWDQVGRVTEIRECLGPNFDVVPEEDHLHVEYDPKTE